VLPNSSPNTQPIAPSAQRPSSARSRHLWIGWAFALLAIALPLAVLAYALITPLAQQLQAAALPASLLQAGGGALHLQLMFVALLPVAGLSYALWHAGRCSGAFAQGQAFQRDAIHALRQCALGMAITALASLALPSLISLLASWHLGSGARSLVISLNSQGLVLLLFAALVAQMAAVLRQGAALAEENAQFV
jgi:hypothetical protein